jgi:hypothetical protein
VWRILTKATSWVINRAIKCSSDIFNAHINLLAQDGRRQVDGIVRIKMQVLIENSDKQRVEEICGGLQQWQQVVLFELTISPLHRVFLLELTDNVEMSFDIERSLLPFPLYELTGVSGTVREGG